MTTGNISENLDHFKNTCIQNNWSLACFKYPHSDDIYLIAGKLAKCNVLQIKPGSFLISEFNNQGMVACIRAESQIKLKVDTGADFELPFYNSEAAKESVSDYRKLIEKGLKSIGDQQLDKVVLARNKVVNLPTNFNVFQFFCRLGKAYPGAFISYVSSPELGVWLGASPELLFKSDGEIFETVSLAGTRTNEELKANMGFSNKDFFEQELVSKYIREQLSDVSFSEKNSEVVNAGNINHIQTVFRANLQNSSFSKVVSKLHPTPAICGYPKQKAMDFILANEDFDRNLYGGFWGFYKQKNDISLYVNLRSMQLFHDKVLIYAGAGIVEGSDPEKELVETQNKMDTLLNLLY